MADMDRCEITIIHKDVINRVKKQLPSEESLIDLADLFKVFGDSTRVRIISSLLRDELCVCDIAALLGMSNSAISHQLSSLRQAKLVKNRRDGKIVYYSLADDHVEALYKAGLEHVTE